MTSIPMTLSDLEGHFVVWKVSNYHTPGNVACIIDGDYDLLFAPFLPVRYFSFFFRGRISHFRSFSLPFVLFRSFALFYAN